MVKTISVHLSDESYNMIKNAADGSKRTISNFMEYATISYLSQEGFVDDLEMEEFLNDNNLLSTIRKAKKDIKAERYRIVE